MSKLKVRYMSDLHLEFENPLRGIVFNIPPHKEDKDTILIVAGDVGLVNSPNTMEMLYKEAHRFRAVLTCMGNHEAYGSSLNKSNLKIRELISKYDNVYLLENDMEIFDDVAFIGATLWSDFNKEDDECMAACGYHMNDYHKITGEETTRKRGLLPKDTLKLHKESVKYIFDQIIVQKYDNRKVVVLTHMGPSSKSINPKYKGQLVEGAYKSNLDEQIIQTKPDVWVHGHIHNSMDYIIGDTRVIVNPRGYLWYEDHTGFDANASFKI